MSSITYASHIPDTHYITRRRIDDQIAHHEAMIHHLKVLRNTYAPIRRLHPEILQEIFHLAHITSHQKGRMTLLMTWICREWRQIAHNTSALWYYIDFKHPEWVKAALSHAKMRNLEFHLHSGNCTCGPHYLLNGVDVAELCLDNLARITNLQITSQTRRLVEQFSRYARLDQWRNPAPLLVELHLGSLTLPEDVFSGAFPSLQILHLSACTFNWNQLPVHSGLKELVLEEPNPLGTVDDLLQVLRVLESNLERLDLAGVFIDTPIPPSIALFSKIQFQKLKLFYVRQRYPEMDAYLLHCVLFPSSITMRITITEWAESDLGEAIASARNMEQNWPVDHVDIVEASGSYLEVRVVESGLNIDECPGTYTLPSRQPHLNLDLFFDNEDLADAIPTLNSLRIHPIEKVHFIAFPECPISDYVADLPNLRELRLHVGDAEKLF